MAHFFRIGSELTEIGQQEAEQQSAGKKLIVAVLTPEEAREDSRLKQYEFLPRKFNQQVRFCKAEAHLDFIYGTFLIPARGKRTEAASFYYVIGKTRLYLIENGSFVLGQIRRLQKGTARHREGLGFLISDFLDLLTADDLLYLTEIEDQLVKLEDAVLSGSLDQFNHKIMKIRRQIMKFSHYYLQLADLSNVLQQNDHEFFVSRELSAFRLFNERVSRLHQQALMLREYSTQIREVYQSQIDINQNKVMRILTVVTTIFLPLTLFVGWYGMNFDMPEFHTKYGYPVFILVSAAIVAACIRICKKKKFF